MLKSTIFFMYSRNQEGVEIISLRVYLVRLLLLFHVPVIPCVPGTAVSCEVLPVDCCRAVPGHRRHHMKHTSLLCLL